MTSHEPDFSIKQEDDLIVVVRSGIQTGESVKAIRREVMEMLKIDGAPKDLLVIALGSSMLDEDAFHESIISMNEIPFRRMAIVGTVPRRLVVAKDIRESSRAGDRVKIFRSEEDARKWLSAYEK